MSLCVLAIEYIPSLSEGKDLDFCQNKKIYTPIAEERISDRAIDARNISFGSERSQSCQRDQRRQQPLRVSKRRQKGDGRWDSPRVLETQKSAARSRRRKPKRKRHCTRRAFPPPRVSSSRPVSSRTGVDGGCRSAGLESLNKEPKGWKGLGAKVVRGKRLARPQTR